jgi:hypothetical protein
MARGRYYWRIGTFVVEDTLGQAGAWRDRSPILPGPMHRAKWYDFFSHIGGPRRQERQSPPYFAERTDFGIFPPRYSKPSRHLSGLGSTVYISSCQEASVLEGLPLLAEIVRRAGNRIVVMPGRGITSHNVERIVSAIKRREKSFRELRSCPSSILRQHVYTRANSDRQSMMASSLRRPRSELPYR